jgi:membrane protease YdiL (CAAX protease family)
LTFVLAAPFWLLGALTGLQLMPGLPIAALMFVCPGLAAILVSRSAGRADLLRRAWTVERGMSWLWFVLALLGPASIALVCLAILRREGIAIPASPVPLTPAFGLFVLFFIAAVGEELGWSSYATGPLQRRWGALGGALALGVVWALFHYVALMEADRSLAWIGWWTLQTVAVRVVLVWFYNNTRGSLLAPSLCHAMNNTAWQLFPVHGSFMDPRLMGWLWAGTAVAIVLLWGPSTLTGWSARRRLR